MSDNICTVVGSSREELDLEHDRFVERVEKERMIWYKAFEGISEKERKGIVERARDYVAQINAYLRSKK
jgi:hypothetical protein